MAAYQAGKAAKVAPPAVSSQTSLPSQTGPIVLIMTRLSMSSPAEERQQDPDAEVESLEDEVAGPQHGDRDEPQVGQVHVGCLPRSVDQVHRRAGVAARRR